MAVAHLVGGEGPLRVLLSRLRQVGLGERVLKSALAAAIAWELARLIPGNPQPVLAPLTAVFSIHLTIAGGVSDAVQRLFGVVFGVGLALLVNRLLGVSGWTIGLVVLVAFFGGRRLRLEAAGLSQMVISALLVVLGATNTEVSNYAALHFANTVIGVLVGLSLNALVAPPSYLPLARRAMRELGEGVAAILDDLATGLASGMTPEQATSCLERARAIASTLDEVEESIAHAEESLKYNVLAGRQRSRLAVYRRSNRALEHAAVQTRVICRAVVEAVATAGAGAARPSWLEPAALGAPLANLFSAVAVAVEHFLTLIDEPRASVDDAALAVEVRRHRQEITLAARERLIDLMPDGWALLGQALAVSSQLVADLTAAANELGELSPPPGRRNDPGESGLPRW